MAEKGRETGEWVTAGEARENKGGVGSSVAPEMVVRVAGDGGAARWCST